MECRDSLIWVSVGTARLDTHKRHELYPYIGGTECRYRLTSDTQALKETDRFTRCDPQIHAHTQGETEYVCRGVIRECSDRFLPGEHQHFTSSDSEWLYAVAGIRPQTYFGGHEDTVEDQHG